jgi:hypothetical protein
MKINKLIWASRRQRAINTRKRLQVRQEIKNKRQAKTLAGQIAIDQLVFNSREIQID